MKMSIKKIVAVVLVVIVLFTIYLCYQIAPAKPLPDKIVDSLFDLRNSSELTNVRAVYLFGGETSEKAEIKFFIGPKTILQRLSRQDIYVGRDDGWFMRWLRGEYPVAGLSGKKAFQNDDLLKRLVHFVIQEGPGFSGEPIRAVLCYIIEKDGDLYDYEIRLAQKNGMYIGNDWQSEDLKRLFLEIEKKYHLQFTDSI